MEYEGIELFYLSLPDLFESRSSQNYWHSIFRRQAREGF